MLGTFVRMVRRRWLFVFCSLVHHSNRPLFMWLQSSTDQEPSNIPPISRDKAPRPGTFRQDTDGMREGTTRNSPRTNKTKEGTAPRDTTTRLVLPDLVYPLLYPTRLYLNIKIVIKIISSSNRKPIVVVNKFLKNGSKR